MGVTQAEYIKTAGQVAVLANNLGFSADQAADFGTRLPVVADNLALLSAGSLSGAEASDVLRSALAGEYDPLQAVGIAISADIVALERDNILKNDSIGLTEMQAGTLATLDIVQRQTAVAADVLATSEGQANQQLEIAKARIGEMTDSLVAGLLPALGSWAGDINIATDNMSNGSSAAEKFMSYIFAINPGLRQGAEAFRDRNDAMFAAEEATDTAAESSMKLAAAADKEALMLDKATQAALNHADTILGAMGSAVGYEAALDDATATIQENGRTLDIHSEKGRNNFNALKNVAQGANEMAASIRASGGSMEAVKLAFDTGTADVIRLGQAMGLSKADAIKLADAMIAIPEEVKTSVAVPGAAQSIDLTTQLSRGLFNLPLGRGSVISTPGATNSIHEVETLDQAIRRLHNKTVTITTVNANVREDRITSRAKGGWVPGQPSAVDTVPLLAAGGEYVINSAAAARWGPILEAINAGRAPGAATFRGSAGGSFAGGGSTVYQVYVTNAIIGNEQEVERFISDALDRIAARGG
jgi:hypothetical protein